MCHIRNITLQPLQSDGKQLDVQDICLMIISTIGVLLNGFLLFGIRLPKTCSVFVRNLAIVDLCTAINSFFWIFCDRISSTESWRNTVVTLSWIFVFISFLTIFAIALQRYIAITHALWTQSVMKNNVRLLRMISASTWLVSVIFGLTRLFVNWNIISFILTIIFEFLILSTITLYFLIFKSFRQCRFNNHHGFFSNEGRLRLQLEKENKLTKTVFWVSGVLIIGVLPYIILLQLGVTKELFNKLDVLNCNKTFKDFAYYWVILEMLAFSLNPAVYLLRYKVDSAKLNYIRHRVLRFLPKRNIQIGSATGNETIEVQTT